jgi:very-short-patch-repair endonuclease
MREENARPDLRAAEIARRQHGVVADWQLRESGLSTSAISRRVAAGRLHRVHRGVYALGHRGGPVHATWMAAVLACGRPGRSESDEEAIDLGDAGSTMTVLDYWGAALSHRAAASLWGLLPPRDEAVDVSIRGYGGRTKRAGIRLHRSSTLLPAHVTLRGRIPVTSPARTIADLRRAVGNGRRSGPISPWELRRAIRQAGVLGLSMGEEGVVRTRSDLERDFLRLCRRYRLPEPEVNERIGSHIVDFLWSDRMLVVETDGYRYHRGRAAFEDDRARDLALRAQGYEVLRLADRQLTNEPQRIVEVIRDRLRT